MSDARFTAVIEEMNARRDKTGVEINGKKYAKVSDRVEVFRQQFGAEFGIDSHTQVSKDFGKNTVVIVSAKIIHVATGNVAGAGTAMNFWGSDEVNTTSIVAVTETSAIGRALASFGLAGGEYASEREMMAVGEKERVVKQSSREPARNRNEADFRQEVDKHFPPSVNQYNFLVPERVDEEGVNIIFTEIDRINDAVELSAYWTALEETLQWVKPEDLEDIKATFKTRNKQLKG